MRVSLLPKNPRRRGGDFQDGREWKGREGEGYHEADFFPFGKKYPIQEYRLTNPFVHEPGAEGKGGGCWEVVGVGDEACWEGGVLEFGVWREASL